MAKFAVVSSSWSGEKLTEDDVGNLVCELTLQELNISASDLLDNKSAYAPTLQGTDVSSLDFDSALDKLITDIPWTAPPNIANGSSPLGSNILIRYSRKRFKMFYIRQDQLGYFWVYPGPCRPYKSLDAVDFSINIYQPLHPEDGIIGAKKSPVSSGNRNDRHERDLIQALVDQYNEDHGHSQGGALELEDLLRMQMFVENNRWYYHFNFTTTQVDAGKKLFFAEVSYKEGTKMLEVSCFCVINANDDGPHCYGCTNYGNPSVKHPKMTDAYTGGHLDLPIPFIVETTTSDDESESEVEVEVELEEEESEEEEEESEVEELEES